MRKKPIKQEVTVVHDKFRRCLPPYEDYHSAGPYERHGARGNRMYINLLKNEHDGFFGILYARYLLEVKLGRRLKDGYEVDHIDGCKWNDHIGNRQELTHDENIAKRGNKLFDEYIYAMGRVMIKCPECGNWFIRTKGNAARKPILFCSQACSGKFNGRRAPLVTMETKPVPLPDISSLPKPFYESFESYSTEYSVTRKVVCATNTRSKIPDADYMNMIIHVIRDLYSENGKVVMLRVGERLNLSDKGAVKVIERIFRKPYKDVVKEICNNIKHISPCSSAR